MKTLELKKKISDLYILAKSNAGLLVFSTILANVFNFVFNAFLGRTLNLEEFGLITMVSTFVYLLNFFISSISTTISYTVSYLEGTGAGKGAPFFRKTWVKIFIPGLLSSIAWVIAVPVIAHFLNVTDYRIIFAFAPAILFGAMSSYNMGYLQGTWSFGTVALLSIFESITKLSAAFIFIYFGFTGLAGLAIPISIFLSWIGSTVFSYIIYKKNSPKENVESDDKFSFSFYIASIMRGVSTVMFLSIDVILAKHYLSPTDAGVYSMLSIVGKMIYFFGSLLNVFVIPLISRSEGAQRNSESKFRKLFAGTAFLSISAGLGVSTLGWFLVPLLLGPGATVVVQYLPLYALAMTLFTLTTTIVIYQLARKHFVFPSISLFMSLGMFAAIYLEHSSVHEFVEAIAKTSILYFILVLFVYMFYDFLVYLYRNFRDAVYVFLPLPKAEEPKDGKIKILVFNWRDTKSVFAGGAETYVQNLASRWVKDGHSVTLFTSNDGHLPANGETDGVRIIRRGGFYATYVLASVYYLVHFRGRFDVIVDSENGIPFFTPIYAKEPVYCLVHHIHQEVFRKSLIWPLAKFACFLEKDLMPIVYRNSNFITVSESSRSEMQKLNITLRDIQVVHPGIDTEFLTPGEKSPVPTVCYMGRLQSHKSVHLLIKAFKDVLKKIPNARLIIAGDGEESLRLRKIAKKINVLDSVDFTGKVTEEEKRNILRRSWLFVTPSMVEGWGITTIEANACGTPVLASDVLGLRDSVRDGETGMLFPYGDVSAISEKVILLLSDETLRKSLSENAISWSKNFSWDKSSSNFISVVSNYAYDFSYVTQTIK